jgi:hypothetical protein
MDIIAESALFINWLVRDLIFISNSNFSIGVTIIRTGGGNSSRFRVLTMGSTLYSRSAFKFECPIHSL